MTCREFKDLLHDHLDDSLDEQRQAGAHTHLAACAGCRQAVQRAQAFSRALEHALHRAADERVLPPARAQRILRAAAPAQVYSWNRPWRQSLPMLAAAAAVVALLALALQFGRAPRRVANGGESRAFHLHSIDVPFQTGTSTGVIHAEFAD